ncbi:MAG TPA: hypothetical protein VF268_00040 [Gammaproteobacteria bacterium]|jgi:hypothetical protein
MNTHIVTTLILASAISTVPAFVAAESAIEHHHGPATVHEVPVKQWETDEPLRRGMRTIRDAAEPALQAYRRKTLTADDARALADTVEENVRYMIANCKLEPEADAALHGLIVQMLQGASRVKTDAMAHDGLSKIVAALARYPDYFKHPGWQPLANTH